MKPAGIPIKPATFEGLKSTTWVSNCGMTLLVPNKESVMPAKRKLTMRQLRQMLRLAGDGTSARDIALTLGVARSTIQDNL